ncbi:DUF2076 domain-containing protein [Methylomonas koyamae]|uniref:Uncharacterized protein n=1 Tax=Methylomonas koyamae TaxID=702114 RepID=A0A291IGZ2_9GAMM|nr:DUF2076 domain-containing protein [Methylomonas koyamae]ATG89613.1 hypothetical protein MKLM6_1359 [Methylomonas koyamae]OAI23413.1 hypothetical protein A1356_01665 [Methylomonas koyamae]
MNPQERDQLNLFLKQLAEARVGAKDAEAAQLIADSVAKQPDAAYLLVQRAMLLEQALNSAKNQIADLQQQLQTSAAAAPRGGFLSNDPWAQAPTAGGVPGAGNYQIPRNAPMPPQASAFGAGSSFLGNIATTAAGVVAGSFLYHGIESLLGGHHGGNEQSLWSQATHETPAEATVVNNYYGDDAVAAATADEHSDYGLDDLGQLDADDTGDDSGWI